MQDDSNFNKDNWFSNIIRKPDSGVIKSEYKTPIFIDDDKNYVIKINEILEKLISDFAVIKDNTLFTEIVCDYQKFLKRVMDFYFQGHIGNAALEMKTYIEDLIDGSKGIALSNIKNSIAFNDKEIIISNIKNDKSIHFFRARVSEHFCEYKRNEMLHIPFNQREKISSARFSIQVHPSERRQPTSTSLPSGLFPNGNASTMSKGRMPCLKNREAGHQKWGKNAQRNQKQT